MIQNGSFTMNWTFNQFSIYFGVIHIGTQVFQKQAIEKVVLIAFYKMFNVTSFLSHPNNVQSVSLHVLNPCKTKTYSRMDVVG